MDIFKVGDVVKYKNGLMTYLVVEIQGGYAKIHARGGLRQAYTVAMTALKLVKHAPIAFKIGNVVKYKNDAAHYIVVGSETNDVVRVEHCESREVCFTSAKNLKLVQDKWWDNSPDAVDSANTTKHRGYKIGDLVTQRASFVEGYVLMISNTHTTIRTASGRQFVSGTHDFARAKLCEDFTMSNNNAGFITGLSNTDLLRLAAAKLVIEGIIADNAAARLVQVTFDEDRGAENTKKRYDYLCPIEGVDVGNKCFVLAPDGQYKIVTVVNVLNLTSEDVVRRMSMSGYENLSSILGVRNPTNSAPLSALFSQKIEELRAQTAVQQVNAFADQLTAGAGITPTPAA